MGSMTTTRRTREDMLRSLLGAQRLIGTSQSSARDRGGERERCGVERCGRFGRYILRLPKTVNHATDVYTSLPRNVDAVPWLACPGYVKKPQDSRTYEYVALVPQGQFHGEHDH